MGNPYDYQPPDAPPPPPPGAGPGGPDSGRRGLVIGGFVGVVVVAILAVVVVTSLGGGEDPPPEEEASESAQTGECGPDTRQPDLGGGHITGDRAALAAEAPSVIYPEEPPTSGRHIGQVVASGIYDVAVDPRFTTHNMEHGYVIAWYSPDAPAEEVEALKTWGEEALAGRYPKLVVAEYHEPLPDGAAVALTAWFFSQACQGFDAAAAEAFLDAHYDTAGEGPEKGLPVHSEDQQGVVGPQAPGQDILLPPLDG